MAFIPNPLIIPVGLIIGILISTPLGPVNLLCLQRAVERGFWGGLACRGRTCKITSFSLSELPR